VKSVFHSYQIKSLGKLAVLTIDDYAPQNSDVKKKKALNVLEQMGDTQFSVFSALNPVNEKMLTQPISDPSWYCID